MIKIDLNTASSTRGRFAHLAVSISLTRPLVSQFELDGKVQKVEYEGLLVICFKCGRYGHSSSNCKESGNSTNSRNVGQAQQAMPGNEVLAHQDVGCNDNSNKESFGPWMIATRRGMKRNSGKENFGDLNRNRELARAGTSRFQILAQVPNECENHVHATFTDIPSTSRQPFIPTSNPTFTSNREIKAKTLARRKPHTKAMVARTQSRKPNVAVNPICNPLQPSGLNIRENDTNPLPHANYNLNSHVTS